MKICPLNKQADKESTLLDCFKISGKAKVWNRTARDSPFHEAARTHGQLCSKRARPGIFSTNVNPFINLAQSAGEGHCKG